MQVHSSHSLSFSPFASGGRVKPVRSSQGAAAYDVAAHVDLSGEAQELLGADAETVALFMEAARQIDEEKQLEDLKTGKPEQAAEASGDESAPEGLSEEDHELLRRLTESDQRVRQHENAHVAAAGGLAGSPSFVFQMGPDGKPYAIGGSVNIDVSEGGSPEETVERARKIRQAALAPADPSGQDLKVAAAASRMERKALAQIAAAKLAYQAGDPADGSQSRTQVQA